MSLKKILGKIHLYVGLITGLVVFIISITGFFYVFEHDITTYLSPPIKVEKQSTKMISVTEARKNALKILPDTHIHGIAYGKKDDPIEVVFFERSPLLYKSVLLNPYTGGFLEKQNHLEGFFSFMIQGHRSLWLPKKIGSPIIAYSTFLFLLMLISGIVLWFPKSKRQYKRKFKFSWKKNTNFKRKNYDLHSVFGFYISSVAFVIAFTGCVMGLGWMYFLTYRGIGGDKDLGFIIPNSTEEVRSENKAKIDQLLPRLSEEYPTAKKLELHYPKSDTSSVYVEIMYDLETHYSSDYRFYDQNTLEEISVNSVYAVYKEADLPDTVIRMGFDIHTGGILGIYTKIIAAIISLLSASLPVTGCLIWWKRRKTKDLINT